MAGKQRGNLVVGKEGFSSLDLTTADYNAMDQELAAYDWDDLFVQCANEAEDDGSLFLERVREIVLLVARKHAKMRKMTGRKKVDRVLRNLVCRRRKLSKRLVHVSPKRFHKVEDELTDVSKRIKEHLLSIEKKTERKVVDAIKVNPKFFYTHVKKHSKLKSSVAPLSREEDGELVTDPVEKAELLQDQFAGVFSDPSAVDPLAAAEAVPEFAEHLTDIVFTPEDIVESLGELKPFSAAPEGDIPAIILKNCRASLCNPLWLLWDRSMRTGGVPEALKSQFITPIFKKGSRSTPSNYRPVSITSHISKVFERIVRKQMADFLEVNGLNCEQQHGFRKGRSTMTQLLSHMDSILKFLTEEEPKEVDVIYLDFSKAFDRVDTEILLAKLRRYGFGGNLLQWIEAWLKGRHQTVVVEGKQSRWERVISGVPQGSVLGPLLFLIYIIDLKSVLLSSQALIFADDTKLIREILTMMDKFALQEDLQRVSEWSVANNMVLHESKFQVLSYTLGRSALLQELPFYAEVSAYSTSNEELIFPVPDVRDLGVQLSSSRNGPFSTHIALIVRRASLLAGWVFSVFRDRSPSVMLTLYKALIRPILEYCCLVWSPSSPGEIQAIENVQRCFTRRVSGMEGADYWERLRRLNLMSLQRRRQRYALIHVWKTYHNLVPDSTGMRKDFDNTGRLGVQLKNAPKYITKADTKRANQLFDSFGVQAYSLWNKLPVEVNSCSTLESFKSALGGFLSSFHDRPPVRGYPIIGNDLVKANRRV